MFRAIRWLKVHNQFYRDVEIDDDSLNEPDPEPHQPQQESEVESPEFESLVIRRDFTLPNVDVQNVITNGNAPVHQLERIRGALVSLFSDRETEQLAFPFLSLMVLMGIAQREIHLHQHWITSRHAS